MNYPWGKETDFENFTYEVDDAHPGVSAVHGEAESIFDCRRDCKAVSSDGADICPSRPTRRISTTSTRGNY